MFADVWNVFLCSNLNESVVSFDIQIVGFSSRKSNQYRRSKPSSIEVDDADTFNFPPKPLLNFIFIHT